MNKESMLSQEEKGTIQINKFIFHIIIQSDVLPKYLDAVDISEDQKEFFKLRLSEAAQGRQFVFLPDSNMGQLSRDILVADDEEFVRLSKEIAGEFQKTHSLSTNSGAFIIATASTSKRNLLFLVKVDNKKIYQYSVLNARALLSEVENTFTEDKSAIQKSALIDVNPDTSWDVLVFDRSSKAEKGNITDYFKRFLGVEVRKTEADLTKDVIKSINQWASNNKSDLDPKQGVATYKNRGREYLKTHEQFVSDDFIDSIIEDEDPDRRERLKKSFSDFLDEKGLSNQNFLIKKEILKDSLVKNIRKTAEGVKIEWSGTESDSNINIPNSPDSNGMYVITIKTSNISEIQ